MERAPPPPKIANLPHYVSRGRDKKWRSVVGIWGLGTIACMQTIENAATPIARAPCYRLDLRPRSDLDGSPFVDAPRTRISERPGPVARIAEQTS